MKKCWLVVAVLILGSSGLSPAADDVATWYNFADYNKAIDTAKRLGRPIALMWQETNSMNATHNDQRKLLENLKPLGYFACVKLDTKEQPELLGKFIQASGLLKQGQSVVVPMVLLGTIDGEFLGVIPAGARSEDAAKTALAALKQYGPLLPAPKALALWKKLEAARKSWSDGKFADALASYQEVRAAQKINSKFPILKEVENDTPEINKKGEELIAQSLQLAKESKFAEAKALIAKICDRFRGFKVAEAAEEAKKQIASEAAKAAEAAEKPEPEQPPKQE